MIETITCHYGVIGWCGRLTDHDAESTPIGVVMVCETLKDGVANLVAGTRVYKGVIEDASPLSEALLDRVDETFRRRVDRCVEDGVASDEIMHAIAQTMVQTSIHLMYVSPTIQFGSSLDLLEHVIDHEMHEVQFGSYHGVVWPKYKGQPVVQTWAIM